MGVVPPSFLSLCMYPSGSRSPPPPPLQRNMRGGPDYIGGTRQLGTPQLNKSLNVYSGLNYPSYLSVHDWSNIPGGSATCTDLDLVEPQSLTLSLISATEDEWEGSPQSFCQKQKPYKSTTPGEAKYAKHAYVQVPVARKSP